MVLKSGAENASAVSATVTNDVSDLIACDSDGVIASAGGNVSATFSGTVVGTITGSNKDYQMHSYIVDSAMLGDDGADKGMSFTFWDSTEETTQGSTSQNAVLYVKNFTVAQGDEVPPTVVVNPFYWNSFDDNSLYGNSRDKGHIELEADWKNATGYSSTATSGQYDGDPKVSGKITFTGTAYDDVRLGSISVTFGSFLNETVIATYDSANSKWTVPEKDVASDGYEFSLVDATGSDVGNYGDSVYFDQKGHKVYWTLSIDTAKITNQVGSDVVLTVLAKDAKNNTTAASSITAPVTTNGYTVTDGTTNKPTYQMDVVPYVNGIKTSLSSLKKTNSSIYDRTALGHYAVDSTETIYVYGFNLTGGSLYDSASTPNTAALAKISDITSLKWYSANAIPAGSVYSAASISAFTSGKVSVKVNSIESLNNLNSNDSKGSYTGTTTLTTGSSSVFANYYNRQPNGDNNNRLTDDVYFDIWEFNSKAVLPISGKIEQPQMAINPVTGQIGFAFVNGPLYFSMPGKIGETDYSYNYWTASFDFFTSVALAYDKKGDSYAVAAGGDINNTDGDKFVFLTDNYGPSFHSDKKYSTYSSDKLLRLESIGQKGDSKGQDKNTVNFDKQRIKSPSFATAVHGDSTNVYLAYYDAINDEIRFKAGNSDTFNTPEDIYNTIPSSVVTVTPTHFNHGGKTDDHLFCNGSISGTLQNGDVVEVYKYENDESPYVSDLYEVQGRESNWFKLVSKTEANNTNDNNEKGVRAEVWYPYPEEIQGTNKGACSPFYLEVQEKQVFAKTKYDSFFDYDTAKAVYEYRHGTVSMLAGSNTGRGAGQYVSLGVVPGTTADTDVVVAVWYDETNRVLQYSYNTSPQTNRNGKTDGEGWTTPIKIFSGDYENAGEYCQVAVDAKGGIHIAAYDPSLCDLVYAYLPSYDGTAQTCVVDSNGVLGSNLTIDVALDESGKAIPRIGYYATSCIRPKLAYLVDTDSAAPDGSIDDAFTGSWECTVVPTPSVVEMQSNQYNKMNVAVWKNKDGKLTSCIDADTFTSTLKSDSSSTSNTPSGYNSTSYGFVYGNGTGKCCVRLCGKERNWRHHRNSPDEIKDLFGPAVSEQV